MSLFANIDHGTLPAGSVVIKKDLDMNNAQYGALGSIVFLGLTFGSLFGANLFNNVSPKLILLFALVLDGTFSWAFTTSDNYPFLVCCRFLTGFA